MNSALGITTGLNCYVGTKGDTDVCNEDKNGCVYSLANNYGMTQRGVGCISGSNSSKLTTCTEETKADFVSTIRAPLAKHCFPTMIYSYKAMLKREMRSFNADSQYLTVWSRG